VHEPKLNHIGLWIDDLEACVNWLTEKKVRFTPGGIRKGAAGHNVCFIHPKGNEDFPFCSEGVLVELVQAPENVIQAFQKKRVGSLFKLLQKVSFCKISRENTWLFSICGQTKNTFAIE